MKCKRTKLQTTISLLKSGWITALQSAQYGGVLSLSQRVGDLEGEYKIARKWVDTQGGSRVLAYRIVGKARPWPFGA